MRRDSVRGFTLIEVIIVLVVLVVLAAVLIPSMVGWVANAEAKKCRVELEGIRREYLAHAAFHAYRVEPGDVPQMLADSAEAYGGAYSGGAFTCPCTNPGRIVTAPSGTAILVIGCTVHGMPRLDTVGAISAMWNEAVLNNAEGTLNTQSIRSYFTQPNGQPYSRRSIDSNGLNWAPGLRSELALFGIEMTDTWRITRDTNTKYDGSMYAVYWTQQDIADESVQPNDRIPCSRVYLDKDGQVIEESRETGQITVIDYDFTQNGVTSTYRILADRTVLPTGYRSDPKP